MAVKITVSGQRARLSGMCLLALAACNQAERGIGPNSNAMTQAAPIPAAAAAPAPPMVEGLPAADAQRMLATINRRLRQRRIAEALPNYGGWVQTSCAELFDVGQSRIVDSSISGQAGRLRVGTRITPRRTVHRKRVGQPAERFVPSQDCYGVAESSGWQVGQPSTVILEVLVERWQSGWNLARTQEAAGYSILGPYPYD